MNLHNKTEILVSDLINLVKANKISQYDKEKAVSVSKIIPDIAALEIVSMAIFREKYYIIPVFKFSDKKYNIDSGFNYITNLVICYYFLKKSIKNKTLKISDKIRIDKFEGLTDEDIFEKFSNSKIKFELT